METTPALPLLAAAHLLTAGLVLFSGLQATWVALLGHRKRLYFAFALMCFSATSFQISQFQYQIADSVAEAVSALRWQFGFASIFMLAFFAFTSVYTKQPHWQRWSVAVALILGSLLIANAWLPFGIRFTSFEAAAPIRMPWGEVVAQFTGSVGWGNHICRVVILGMFSWALWRALMEFRKGRKRVAVFLSSCVLLLMAGSAWGALIDVGAIQSFYVIGFSYTALALFMSFELAVELRDRTLQLSATSDDLKAEIERRRKSDRAISHIAAGVAMETGERFFQQLVVELSTLFAAEYAFVAIPDSDNRERARSLAICAAGRPAENRLFDLGVSSWGQAIGHGPLVLASGARGAFPADPLLHEREIESLIAMPLFDASGNALGVIVVLHREIMDHPARVLEVLEIVGARAAAEIQRSHDEVDIRRLAYQDHLTGLANRARFQDYLESSLIRARQMQRFGAILLVDLDHFKTINDALSHDVGDQVLIKVAGRLRECAPGAFLARLGGDEFVIALPDLLAEGEAAAAAIRALAHCIIEALAEPLHVGGHILNVRASIGVAPYPNQDSTAIDSLRQADLALYRAKQKGRGLVQFYEASMQVSAAERLTLEKGLREALAESQLILHYQPQVDATGTMIGAEVLVRWEHPELGSVPPSTFVAVAEEAGLIHALGSWVLDRSCAVLARWRTQKIPLCGRLSVNISPWQFARPDFLSQINELLAKHDIAPNELILEITESSLLYDVGDAVEKLHSLRALGFKVALDDFGTGYSSLAYLRELPLDELKIDRTFVHDLHIGSNAALVQSMIAVAKHMGLHAIAEGVESECQRDTLVAMGCHSFQGYFFSRPLPEAEFVEWVVGNSRARVNCA